MILLHDSAERLINSCSGINIVAVESGITAVNWLILKLLMSLSGSLG